MAKIADLPVEILLRIFKFYLEQNNQRSLLRNLSRVCRMWKTVCESNLLWKKFDGTVDYFTMEELCSKGCLDFTKELIVSHTELMTEEDATNLFYILKHVEIINLQQVEDFSGDVMSVLALSDLKLKEIIIGNSKTEPCSKKPINYSNIKEFFILKGGDLTKIKLSYCNIKSASQILMCISENCINLEHFEFINNSNMCTNFPTKHFQLNCPKLKVLHLDYHVILAKVNRPSGFPNLEVFSFADENMRSRISDNDIECILFNSPNLKFLSLINCSLSPHVLFSLPANSIEYLFLSKSKLINSEFLQDLFVKWCYTLKQVDISYAKSMFVNDAVRVFSTLPLEPPLEFLDLSYTLITHDTVKMLLKKCRRLKMLDLTGCRSLARGLKRRFRNEMELKGLLEKLQTFAYNDSTDEEISM